MWGKFFFWDFLTLNLDKKLSIILERCVVFLVLEPITNSTNKWRNPRDRAQICFSARFPFLINTSTTAHYFPTENNPHTCNMICKQTPLDTIKWEQKKLRTCVRARGKKRPPQTETEWELFCWRLGEGSGNNGLAWRAALRHLLDLHPCLAYDHQHHRSWRSFLWRHWLNRPVPWNMSAVHYFEYTWYFNSKPIHWFTSFWRTRVDTLLITRLAFF